MSSSFTIYQTPSQTERDLPEYNIELQHLLSIKSNTTNMSSFNCLSIKDAALFTFVKYFFLRNNERPLLEFA